MLRGVSNHRPRRIAVALALIFAATFFARLPTSFGAATTPETWTVAGKTYERVRVLEVSAATVMIAHAGGMVQLDLAALSPEMQQRFNYDPARAEAWKREAASGIAATEALKLEEERARKNRNALEEMRRRIEQRNLEADPNYVELRAEVDLRPIFIEHNLYLKNQGARPSCSIFAVVSVLEYEYARRFGSSDQLSEEYLVWALRKSRPGTPINDGYHFREVLEVLRECGVARRSTVPGSFASSQRDENPPIEALDDAVTRRTANPVWLNPQDPAILMQIALAMNQELPVIIGIRWPPQSKLEHNNLLKDQVPQPGAGHAVTLVGYTSDGTPESLQFIFRNSYGPQWGLGGYGLMTGSYLQKNLISAFCRVVPVPE